MIITGHGRRISKAEAKKLVDEYKAKKEPHLKKAMGKDETTSVWFDYDFCIMLMQDLLRKEINGLRIYFGAHDKVHSDPDKKDKMTAVFVTTTGDRTADWGNDDFTTVIKEELLTEYNDGKICPPKCQGVGL
jgi:hypothetical protein